MNRETLQTSWPQVREILREKFSNLTEEDINQINGRYDQLVTKLQQKYGYSREEAEERIRSWNFDRFTTTTTTTTPRREVHTEEKIRNDYTQKDDNSIYKWLLGLGIPLLLLGTYFLTSDNREVVNPPAVTQERTIVETPADRAISNDLMSTFFSQPNIAPEMQNVRITTNNGVVTLSGSVPNNQTRDFIVTTSQNHSGVRQVIDNLQIR